MTGITGRKSRAGAATRKRVRKPRIDVMIRQAERAGKVVTAVTTPDGVTLTFGKAESTTTDNEANEWDKLQ